MMEIRDVKPLFFTPGTFEPDTRADWMNTSLVPLTPPEPILDGREFLDRVASDCGDLMVPGKVLASGYIPLGTMSAPIDSYTLFGKIQTQQISVGANSCGTMDLDKHSKELWNTDVHWVRAIRLSDDCHTYNVQLKVQPSSRKCQIVRGAFQGKLVLQTVRPLAIGQELQLWFSEDILAILQVVFLNPSNIQGQNKYICNRCSALYETPNPLKLHITLACGKLPITALWERLASLMRNPQADQNVATPRLPDFQFRLTSSKPSLTTKQKSALDLTLGSQTGFGNVLYRPYAECSSAFKPFKKDHHVEINENAAEPTKVANDFPPLWPMTFETDVMQLHRNLMQNHVLSNGQIVNGDDAHIESLVSSLGKAKQGHICLYCGKCYSRKYGLKIHIRTHTGYKPLRCKFCDRPFGDPSNLNKHVRLHAEGNTPYKCDLCGKILVRRRDLERHLKSRHMMEMNPGQNILSDSPTLTNENSNSLPDILESPEGLSGVSEMIADSVNDPIPSAEYADSKLPIGYDITADIEDDDDCSK